MIQSLHDSIASLGDNALTEEQTKSATDVVSFVVLKYLHKRRQKRAENIKEADIDEDDEVRIAFEEKKRR